MRLLYVIDSLAPGGAETSLAEMAPELVRRGVELHVLPLGSQRDLAPRLSQSGAVTHPGPSGNSRVSNIKAVLQTAKSIRPDLVHTTLYEADIAGRTAARLLGVPSSSSLVNDSYGASHYAESVTAKLHAARAVDALTAQFAKRFHAITRAIAESVPPRIGVPTDMVDIIPRGRDPLFYPLRTPEQTAQIRANLGLADGAPVILAVGRLEPQKGLHHLLSALPTVAHEHPRLVTLIAGKDGRAAASLKDQARRLRLDVRFLGHRDDVPQLLAAADVLCFPSEREGFGGVLIEALAVGCPIVASRIPTTLEVLGTPRGVHAGVLCEVGDAQSLSAGLRAALIDPVGNRRQSNAGRSLFEERFTISAVSAQLLDFFAAASWRPGPPGRARHQIPPLNSAPAQSRRMTPPRG